jgi:hypothetical protein
MQLESFSSACEDYVKLQDEEEINKCKAISEEFSRNMEQLRNSHNGTFDKNLVIAARLLDVPLELLPTPGTHCSSQEFYVGLTEEQCQKAKGR